MSNPLDPQAVRAAAERTRLRRARKLECSTPTAARDLAIDFVTLADAYLAEHREDDEQPITGDWLTAAGFASDAAGFEWFVETPCGVYLLESPGDGEVWITSNGASAGYLGRGWTRGRFRLLCRALGVELKEKQ